VFEKRDELMTGVTHRRLLEACCPPAVPHPKVAYRRYAAIVRKVEPLVVLDVSWCFFEQREGRAAKTLLRLDGPLSAFPVVLGRPDRSNVIMRIVGRFGARRAQNDGRWAIAGPAGGGSGCFF